MNRNQILDEIRMELKKYVKVREAEAVTFADDIDVEMINDIVQISLSDKAIGISEDRQDIYNMQDDSAAFEGWALIIYTYFGKKRNLNVQLALKEEVYERVQGLIEDGNNFGKRGHYYRFLYRAFRFSEQYKWFRLEQRLEEVVNGFRDYLQENLPFTNNYPNGEKKVSITGKENENHIEDLFSDEKWQDSVEGQKICKKFGIPIFRQLPVGLFAKEKKAESAIFTGKKSAIDLWCCDDDSITIFELKWKNKMIGIITELFFYCNYMKDMYGVRGDLSQNLFVPHNIDICKIRNLKKYRGYEKICNRKFSRINGYMLCDMRSLHQTITESVLSEMNNAFFDNNETEIKYGLIEYEVVNDVLKIERIK